MHREGKIIDLPSDKSGLDEATENSVSAAEKSSESVNSTRSIISELEDPNVVSSPIPSTIPIFNQLVNSSNPPSSRRIIKLQNY